MPHLPVTLPSASDPSASQHHLGTQYATASLDQSAHLQKSGGWEWMTLSWVQKESMHRYDTQKRGINCECGLSSAPYQNMVHSGFSECAKSSSTPSYPPVHESESRWARVLRWRNSISAESGVDERSEPTMSDQDGLTETDGSDEETATHPDDSSEACSSEATDKVSLEDDFRVINITDLEAVTAELEKEGLKWRVFYPPRRSCSNHRDVWLAVGPTDSIVDCAARRIMSGAMKIATPISTRKP